MKESISVICLSANLLCAWIALGMPSQKEISEVQPLVAELMKPSVSAFKAKKMSGTEVGDKALSLAESASTDAAVFMCMKGSVTYYVRDRAYDKAADVIESIMSKFPDMPPETLHEITSSATKNVSAKSAQRLLDLHKMAARQVANRKRLRTVRLQLRETPSDKNLICRCAELSAASGDWADAVRLFSKLDGDVGKMAKSWIEGNASYEERADYWWNYTPKESTVKDAMLEYAAKCYRTALENGVLDGLKEAVAWRRISEVAKANPKLKALMEPIATQNNCESFEAPGDAPEAEKPAKYTMPTAEELAGAKPLVTDKMKAAIDEYKQGYKSGYQVASAALKLAYEMRKSNSAAVLLLRRTAATYYVREKDYDGGGVVIRPK